VGPGGSLYGRGRHLWKRPNMPLEPRESTGIPVRASGTNGLRLTPSVGALQWLVTSVGIRPTIESFWERSSPQKTRDFAAPGR
jgi:hypothetical protein